MEFASAWYPYYLLVTASEPQRAQGDAEASHQAAGLCFAAGSVPCHCSLLSSSRTYFTWGTFAPPKAQILLSFTHCMVCVQWKEQKDCTQRCMSNKHTCRGEGSTLYCCFSNTAYYVLVRITKEIKWQTTLKSIYTEYCSGKNNFLNLSGVLGQTKESIFLMVCIWMRTQEQSRLVLGIFMLENPV